MKNANYPLFLDEKLRLRDLITCSFQIREKQSDLHLTNIIVTAMWLMDQKESK